MENAISIPDSVEASYSSPRIAADTTYVLFFLTMDLAGNMQSMAFESILSGLTITAFLILPYLLPFAGGKTEFTSWLAKRLFITAVGFTAGLAFQAGLGTVLPESVKFLPMTFLIISGIFCAITQIRGIIGVRLAS
jgi:hypothetical protein